MVSSADLNEATDSLLALGLLNALPLPPDPLLWLLFFGDGLLTSRTVSHESVNRATKSSSGLDVLIASVITGLSILCEYERVPKARTT